MSKSTMSEEKINTVFANRKDYDKERYIPREKYEKDLIRAIERYRYVFITGESGSGKTWLADYCLSSTRKMKNYINLAEVGVTGGLISFLKGRMPEVRTKRTSSAKGGVNVSIVSGSGETTSTFEINNDYLWEFIKSNKNHVVVLDNFESIINNEAVLNDISYLIMLADDPRMIEYNPRFLIIGALRDVVQYFQTMPNYQTIANRVRTVSIKGFTYDETYEFVKKGFLDCGFSLIEPGLVASRIYDCTNGFPQAVNELCYDIAITHFDRGIPVITDSSDAFYYGEIKWLKESMMAEYSVINGYFIENISNNPLFNYILYALSEFDTHEFSVSQMRAKAEELMGDSNEGITLAKAREYLDRLSEEKDNRNILIKTNADGYRLKSFKTMACILITLHIDNDQVRCSDDFDIVE